ncbi:hypothetical protein H1C71_031036 [Ictidomys tridecemlineatus]|nr:hypothetical protein H1C71_031036 [Ictidomys tridecemlineatus]KAG3272777.1 hypothetical protein H1C71_031036 [Ictidomys tridecemlineatus]KAG3272780.1 hypothetical protein H1C71_031036 [Ictidomys tridecemlineatus]
MSLLPPWAQKQAQTPTGASVCWNFVAPGPISTPRAWSLPTPPPIHQMDVPWEGTQLPLWGQIHTRTCTHEHAQAPAQRCCHLLAGLISVGPPQLPPAPPPGPPEASCLNATTAELDSPGRSRRLCLLTTTTNNTHRHPSRSIY